MTVFSGKAVDVGVTMYVLSISSLSEVEMVLGKIIIISKIIVFKWFLVFSNSNLHPNQIFPLMVLVFLTFLTKEN